MFLPFDATLKDLVQAHPADWLAGLDYPVSGPVEALTPDLSTLTAFTDIVLRTGTSLLHEAEAPAEQVAMLLTASLVLAGLRVSRERGAELFQGVEKDA